MRRTCFRCDWAGDAEGEDCPTCGAPLYPPARSVREPKRPSPAPEMAVDEEGEDPTGVAAGPAAPTSPVPVLVTVAAIFLVILLLLARGDPDEPDGGVGPIETTETPGRTGGRLIYTVSAADGTSRLWRWDLIGGEVSRGPVVRHPVALVNILSPGYGWLGVTSEDALGAREAAVLDSLEPGSVARSLGGGDIVTWTKRGGMVLFVDRGTLRDRCRREVEVTAVSLQPSARETVLHDTICGDVVSAGRTSLGYFLTVLGPEGADVVGMGYPDAGVLLRDHGVIDISPNGQMLVTEESEFLPGPLTTVDDPPPLVPTGSASRYRLFEPGPAELLSDSVPIRIDEVLAYTAAGSRALVIGRQGSDGRALWELPLGIVGLEHQVPRFLMPVRGVTEAAYASDGTAFVLTDGRLWHVRDDRLVRVRLPEGAPTPDGPLAWIVREPARPLSP